MSVVVVTGGAEGIGLSIARRFAKDGAQIVLADLNDQLAETSAEAIRTEGGVAFARPLDVADHASVQALFAEVGERFGRVDVLVNNAGIAAFSPADAMAAEAWGRVIAVNMTGTFLACQAAFPWMCQAGGGAIVNIASLAAHVAAPGSAAYSASKSGVLGLTRALAVEWAGHGIRVNAISPGSIDTRLSRESRDRDPARFAAREARVPLRRTASVEDIADAAYFLGMASASHITGQDLVIDGGISACHAGYVP